MAHAATFKRSEYIPPKAKVMYVAIAATLLALVIAFFVITGILNNVDNESVPIQQHTNSTSPGSTEQTGAPTDNSGTPSDRVTPAPSGAGGNTLLNPEDSTF